MITQAREALAARITEAGVSCKNQVVGTVAPPVVLVSFGSPMLSEAQYTFDGLNSFDVNLDLLFVVRHTTDAGLAELEQMIETVLPVVVQEGWEFDEVSQPQTITAQNQNYFGAVLSITKSLNTKE